MIGPPIGVLPLKVTDHSAITPPRKLGSVVSCRVLLPVAMNVVLAAPTSTSASSSVASVGTTGGRQERNAECERGRGQRLNPGDARGRHQQAARDSADAHRRGQEPEHLRATVQRGVRKQRQHNLELVRQRADQRHHQQRHKQAPRRAHIMKPGAQLPWLPRNGRRGVQLA